MCESCLLLIFLCIQAIHGFHPSGEAVVQSCSSSFVAKQRKVTRQRAKTILDKNAKVKTRDRSTKLPLLADSVSELVTLLYFTNLRVY